MSNPSKNHANWTLKDVVNFESQRYLDAGLDEGALESRDRLIYRQRCQSQIHDGRRQLLWSWLRGICQIRPLNPEPGQVFGASYGWLSLLATGFAFLSGVGTTWTVLRYDGTVPVNISIFLGVIVAPQMLLLIGYAVVVMLALVRANLLAFCYVIPAKIGNRFIQIVWTQFSQRSLIKSEKRDEIRLLLNKFSDLFRAHRNLFANRVFRLVQLAGIFFNLAVVICMALLLLVTDRAFGWQSSLVDSPEQVESIVEKVSAPWRILMPVSVARPSLEAIQGSRIVLRESDAPLASGDLLSWWPFLMWCVLFYGLTPRFLAWIFSLWNETRLLRQLNFDGFDYSILLERMQSIDLSAQGVATQSRGERFDFGETEASEISQDITKVDFHILKTSVDRYGVERLKGWLGRHFGSIDAELKIMTSLELEYLDGTTKTPLAHYLLIEGWQAPIQEVLSQLQLMAKTIQPNGQRLVLVLLGKPSEGDFRPVTDAMQKVWRAKVQMMQCANVSVLVP